MNWRASAAVVALLTAGLSAAAPGSTRSFDGARAYEHLRQIVSLGPRPAGSSALAETRRYITGQLSSTGVKVTEQPFDAETPLGRLRMVNLVATIPGKVTERIVIAGHYDTKLFREFRFVGASDGGSSAAFLIELASVLATRSNRYSMELVWLDGEEALIEWTGNDHTYGSRYYVEAARQSGALGGLRAMILIDMIGDRQLTIRREENSTPWLNEAIWGAARTLQLTDYFLEEGSLRIEDDHLPFLRAGVPAVDLIDFEYPAWHTPGDTLDRVSSRSLQVVGQVLLQALPAIERRLASSRKS